MKPTVSMKDISVACGVSIATVSKALSDRSDIGHETKEHIRKVADEMGYFPNAAAQALKTHRSNNIGVLFVDDAQSGLTHDFFAHVLDSFKRTAEQNGYDITFINCNSEKMNDMSYIAHALYRGFDGVVIACVDFYDPKVEQLVRSNIPLVTIDHVFNDRIAVLSDNVRGVRELLNYCYEQGHRRIAYIHGAYSAVTQNRLSSFYNTAEKLGLSIPDEYVIEAEYRNIEQTYLATKKLLALKEPPTCIMFPDDYASFGGMGAIQEAGLRIPGDISMVGYDGITIGQQMHPQLTTYIQDTGAIGSIAAEKLINLIERPRTTLVENVMVQGTLSEGDTVSKIV